MEGLYAPFSLEPKILVISKEYLLQRIGLMFSYVAF